MMSSAKGVEMPYHLSLTWLPFFMFTLFTRFHLKTQNENLKKILSTCACVIQLQRCHTSSRPTPSTATASPWSSARLLGRPATSWGRSHWTAAFSLRWWWAAPPAPWCSCSPTPATGWASCLSTLGGRASRPTPSRPGQVTSSTPNVCRGTEDRDSIYSASSQNTWIDLKKEKICHAWCSLSLAHLPPCKSRWLLQLRESEMQPDCCSHKNNSLLSHSASLASVAFHNALSHSLLTFCHQHSSDTVSSACTP